MAIKNIPPETESFHYVNTNPKDRRTGDCAIRAIALASGLSWDEVVDIVTAKAHKTKRWGDDRIYADVLVDLGFKPIPQPRRANGKKYTGSEFCDTLNFGPHKEMGIVCNIGTGHMTAILPIDGDMKICDIWNCSTRAVGKLWVKETV